MKVDHPTEETFRLTPARILKSGGGELAFAVGTKTKNVAVIGIPFIAFCE